MTITVHSIKISKLLKRFKKKPNLEFICHAAEQIFEKKTGIKDASAISKATHQELRRIAPDLIRKNYKGYGILPDWTKGLPPDLEEIKDYDDHEFRVLFLKLMLRQVGDKKIKFEFYHD